MESVIVTIFWPAWLNQEYIGWWMYQHEMPREEAAEKLKQQCHGLLPWAPDELVKLREVITERLPNVQLGFYRELDRAIYSTGLAGKTSKEEVGQAPISITKS